MSFPTEAYMNAAANAAKIQAEAQARMGEQIGKGLQSAASSISGAMTEKAAEKADYDASLKLYDSPSFQKAMGLTTEDADKEKKILKDLVGEGGYKAANSYAKQGISPLFKYAQMGKELEIQKQLVSARAGAEAGLIDKRFQSDLSLAGAKSMLDRKASTGSTLPPPAPTESFKPKSFTLGGENQEYSWMLPTPSPRR